MSQETGESLPETPAIIIDEAIAQANIARLQAHCDARGVRLRPHIKTHKLPRFARAQVEAGASGITCQKISEAEIMADGGIDDILITYNIVGDAKLKRLRALAGRLRHLGVTADSAATVDGLSSAFADAPRPLEVLVECDTGAGRCGVQTPREAADLAARINAAPGLSFGGLMTFPAVGDMTGVARFMREALALLDERGIACPDVSSGGTPDMWKAGDEDIVTEYRAGTYIFNDRAVVASGACTLEDCAVKVHATVVSTPTPNRAVVDAGSKTLTTDLFGQTGHGTVIGHPEAKIVGLSEEHGVIHTPKAGSFQVGERIEIVPNHVCVVVNMFDTAWLRRKDGTLEEIAIDARGKVT
jgi:D-serine deaminase-like pyridoxal phosphate-dependent protein